MAAFDPQLPIELSESRRTREAKGLRTLRSPA